MKNVLGLTGMDLVDWVRLIWAVGFRSGGQDWIRRFGAALDAGSSRLRRRAAVSSPDFAQTAVRARFWTRFGLGASACAGERIWELWEASWRLDRGVRH